MEAINVVCCHFIDESLTTDCEKFLPYAVSLFQGFHRAFILTVPLVEFQRAPEILPSRLLYDFRPCCRRVLPCR